MSKGRDKRRKAKARKQKHLATQALVRDKQTTERTESNGKE